MSWPFEKKEEVNPAEAKPAGEEKPVAEKSPADLIADSLRPVVESINSLSTRFDELQQNVVRKPEERRDPVQPTSVLDDENVAFAQRLTPIMLRQLEVEARLVRSDIQREYNRAGFGEMWEQFEGEINQVLEGTPVVNGEGKPLRGDPQYIRNVVDMVLGRAARKAGMRFDGKNKGFFLESASGDAGHGRSEPETDGLSDGQRRVMQRMKISTEEAKKVMAKLKFVS